MNQLNTENWQQGFILSADVIYQNGIERVRLWLKTANGIEQVCTPPQPSVAFVEQHWGDRVRTIANSNASVRLEDSHLLTFENKAVWVVKASTQKAMRLFESQCRQSGIALYESDIKLTERYIMERFVYGSAQYICQPSVQIRPCNFKPVLRYLVVDIECDEHGQLFSIGCDDGEHGIVFMRDDKLITHTEKPFEYVPCANEARVLEAWVDYMLTYDPDVITGWNVKQFDCRILFERAQFLSIRLCIGRDGSPMSVRKTANDQYWVEIAGRAVVDGIESLKTMTYSFPNFTLETVASQLLDEHKLVHDVDQLGTIKRLFNEDKPKLAHYNWQDCRLVAAILNKTKLLQFLILRASLTGLFISRPGGSVAAFINCYLPHVHRAGYVAPRLPEDGGLASPGGYVMTSNPGMYRHIILLDFKSLYPSIIRTFLIDPVGLVEGLKESDDYNVIPGFKRAKFSRHIHFLPKIIDQLWQQRDEAKAAGDNILSQAIKIIMNSFYGVLGSGGCPFYDTRLASSITLRGHEIMQLTKQWIDSLGYKVIYGDTDSTFVWLENCTSAEQAVSEANSLVKEINQKWQTYIRETYKTDCFLDLEFETHFERFFMPTIRHSEKGSKKRYAGLTGKFHGNQLIFKGLESVRSDWTALAKQFQTTLYAKIFADEAVEDYICDTIKQTLNGKFDDQLIYQRKLKKPVEEYVKTKPPHVKAAAIANLQAAKLDKPIPYPAKSMVYFTISTNGPAPVGHAGKLDYAHYIDKQIKPIADSILPHIGLSFDAMTNKQLPLF